MRLDCDFKNLFYEPNECILGLVDSLSEDDWLENTFRQQTFHVHKQTRSIIYIWSLTDYDNIEVKISEEKNPLSALVYKISNKIKSHYKENCIITKLMLVDLPPNCEIPEHPDSHILELIHRCHYVIKTNEECNFVINGNSYNFTEGQAFEFNNQALHSFSNHGKTNRVHLICDILER